MTTRTAPSPAKIEDKALQLQREMAEIVREEIGMHDPIAQAIAEAIVRGMRKRFGGEKLGRGGELYIPSPDKTERNAAIKRQFNGTNAKEVCKEYGISMPTLYRIAG